MSEKLSAKNRTDLISAQIEHLASHLAHAAGEKGFSVGVTPTSHAVAYVLYLAAKDEKCLDVPDLKSFLAENNVDAQLRTFIGDRIGKGWNAYRQLIRSYSQAEIARYILDYNADGKMTGWQSSAEPVSMLACKLLGIEKGQSVADICCGAGSFMKVVSTEVPGCSFTGLELSAELVCVSKIRASVLGGDISIVQGDALDTGSKYQGKFDRVFCDPPYAMPLEHIHCLISGNGNEMRATFFPPTFPSLRGRTTSEWVWLLKALEMLKPGGKAAVVMPLGRLFGSQAERQYRRYLVENGLVESVVALPGNLLDYTGIRLGLVILSTGNDEVKLIDANDLCKRQRGRNVMTTDHLEKIASATEKDDFCHFADGKEIAEHDFSLDPAAYMTNVPEVPLAKPLSDFVMSVGRGLAAGKDNLAEDQGTEATCRLVKVSDIRDGQIMDDLSPLGGAPEQYARYVIEDGDVLLGKVPAPLKAAVAMVPKGVTLVASVNLYILKLNKEKCDPYYLQAYLSSKLGQAQIATAVTGVALQTITADGLLKIPFPALTLEEQRAFAEEFKKKLKFARMIREQAEKAAMEAESAFDAFVAGEDKR